MKNQVTTQQFSPMVIGIQGLDKPVSLTIGKNNVITLNVDGIEQKIKAITAQHIERRGRKVDPNSERQKRLNSIKAKLDAGIEIKPGRPALNEERAERINARIKVIHEAPESKLGRPIDYTSARQQRIAMRLEKIEAGLNVKPGRPSAVEAERIKDLVHA